MRRVLTFLSDFGSNSPYPAAMKAVAASITDALFVDITHDIKPHDIPEGAFVLWSVARYFPAGTIHCAVVDPGVGTERRGLIIEAGKQLFVGPDNGLLAPAAQTLGTPRAYEICNVRYLRDARSPTFHGRDIFAPVAAHLASGVSPEELGKPVFQWVSPELDFENGKYDESEKAFHGHVIYIDHFGNAITNIHAELIQECLNFQKELVLNVGSRESRVYLRESYGFARPNELCLILGSHDLLEIAVREGSAEKALGLKIKESVILRML